MKEVRLKNGFGYFCFPEQEGFDYGFNIYALHDGRSVLLLDAAFRSQITAVKKYFENAGHEITHVLASHFHNDHIAGLMALPEKVSVLGSPEYRITLAKSIPQNVTPVSFTEPFRFGEFTLNFTPAPGHSPCSIFTDINGEYLHAGDNLMSRYDGRRILPWVEPTHIAEHIRSLEMLRQMERERILLSHGPMLKGVETIIREIELRLHYLRGVLNPVGNPTIEDVLPDSPDNWVSTEFYNQLMESISLEK